MTDRLELAGMRNYDYRKLKAMKLIRHKECCSIDCNCWCVVCVYLRLLGCHYFTMCMCIGIELMHMMCVH